MNKTKAEIEQMASFICREKGQYMFNKKEIGIITGLCKDKVAELCENIPAACDSRVKLYFIKDVQNYSTIPDEIYNSNSAYRSKFHKKCVSFLSGIGLAICKTVW